MRLYGTHGIWLDLSWNTSTAKCSIFTHKHLLCFPTENVHRDESRPWSCSFERVKTCCGNVSATAHWKRLLVSFCHTSMIYPLPLALIWYISKSQRQIVVEEDDRFLSEIPEAMHEKSPLGSTFGSQSPCSNQEATALLILNVIFTVINPKQIDYSRVNPFHTMKLGRISFWRFLRLRSRADRR